MLIRALPDIREISIDNYGNAGILIRGKQDGHTFEMKLPITGEVRDLLVDFEKHLLRIAEEKRENEARIHDHAQLELAV
jgi:hypothetical protein